MKKPNSGIVGMRTSLHSLFFGMILLLQSCGTVPSTGYTLAIAHLNDTHSHLETVSTNLTIDGKATTVEAGGFPRLQTLVDEMRAENPNFLLLHAGDAVQGTLYFTLFRGSAEFDFLNRLGVDAMTFGNHEFDRGAAAIAAYLKWAQFPLISANIDFSAEKSLDEPIPKHVIREIHGERIGIFGLTTETTPQSTFDVGRTRFLDTVAAARRQVKELEEQGVNKIIALTHLGHQDDLKLALAVEGIDVIVGGHSHTLLGGQESLDLIGLSTEGPYPTVVTTPGGGRTLVLQAWQWGEMLGNVRVIFDSEGRVRNQSASAVIPMGDQFTRNGIPISPDSPEYRKIVKALHDSGMARIVAEDEATLTALAPLRAQLTEFRSQRVATATEDLPRKTNQGPGVLAADSMLAALPGVRIALLNFGGVRKDLLAGPVSTGDVLEMMPFGNTLVTIDLSGAELKNALEEGVEFLLRKHGHSALLLPYVAGIRCTLTTSAEKGHRIAALEVRGDDGTYRPVQPTATYPIVVNNFLAKGGDGFCTLRDSKGRRIDTGILDSDAFRDHLKRLGTLSNPSEQRIRLLESPSASLIPYPMTTPDRSALRRFATILISGLAPIRHGSSPAAF